MPELFALHILRHVGPRGARHSARTGRKKLQTPRCLSADRNCGTCSRACSGAEGTPLGPSAALVPMAKSTPVLRAALLLPQTRISAIILLSATVVLSLFASVEDSSNISGFRQLTAVRAGAFDPSSQKQGVGIRKSEISTREELLDLWREFSLVPIRNYGYRAGPTSIGSKSTAWGNLRGMPVWHNTCKVSGTS
jgi:hypothetical protein